MVTKVIRLRNEEIVAFCAVLNVSSTGVKHMDNPSEMYQRKPTGGAFWKKAVAVLLFVVFAVVFIYFNISINFAPESYDALGGHVQILTNILAGFILVLFYWVWQLKRELEELKKNQ